MTIFFVGKKFFLPLVLLAVAAFGVSTAKAATFDGPYIQGTLGVAKGETRLRDFNPDTTVSDQSGKGTIALGYSRSFGAINVSGSVFTMTGRVSSGSISGEDFSGPWRDDFNLRRIWGLSIEPGIYLAPQTLAYTKVSYVRARGSNNYDYDRGSDAGSASHNHSGIGLGFGLRQAFGSRTDLVFEVQQTQFSSAEYWDDTRESYRPSVLTIGLGVAVRF